MLEKLPYTINLKDITIALKSSSSSILFSNIVNLNETELMCTKISKYFTYVASRKTLENIAMTAN
jgi:uncharacterized protein (DUF1810 family)